MNIVCLDLEGVLVPEIWIAFSEASGIPELRRTTAEPLDEERIFRSDLEQPLFRHAFGSQYPHLALGRRRKRDAAAARRADDYELTGFQGTFPHPWRRGTPKRRR